MDTSHPQQGQEPPASGAGRAGRPGGPIHDPDAAMGSATWQRARKRAQSLAGDSARLSWLGDAADEHTTGRALGRLDALLEDVKALIRLVRAYARGDYREVAFDNLVVIVAGLLYLASPIDLIPDFLGPIGFADDAVILKYVLTTVADEVHAFREWEAETR